MIQHPISIYLNWSAYDELSDKVPLTEKIAMDQLVELERLQKKGVRWDYYLMDAFWHAPEGGYRHWRRPHWRDDGETWLAACAELGILPGLWFGCNQILGSKMSVMPEWRSSMDGEGKAACLFHGGFLPHFMETLDGWYGRGVRAFKFDFLELDAATPELARTLLPSEIRAMNTASFRSALLSFRQKHPDVVLIGYNGFEERDTQTSTDHPLIKSMDSRWLECLDSFYTGDPRPADVPISGFWRSKDIYSDHRVAHFHAQGFPLHRLDSSSFMIGTTGTCYHRGKKGWKGMLILQLARGSWVNTYYGNLDLLSDEEAVWFAKAQRLWRPLKSRAVFSLFGGLPGKAEPYGYSADFEEGSVRVVVNPSQSAASLALPASGGRVLFHDDGFSPLLRNSEIFLAPEQLAVVVGFGKFDSEVWDLGSCGDNTVAASIRALSAKTSWDGSHQVSAVIEDPPASRLRVILKQFEPISEAGGNVRSRKSTGGAPPNGTTLGKIFFLNAMQKDRSLSMKINYDKAIWSGLSWAVGEMEAADIRPGIPLKIVAGSLERAPVSLTIEVYALNE